MFKGIDLLSDTATRPSAAMKSAMFEAELGDEQLGEDPTTRTLEEKAATLLGFANAMFFPSATMANEAALKLHCRPGDTLLAAGQCHLFFAEAGGPAVHAQVLARPIDTDNGLFEVKDIEKVIPKLIGPHYSSATLLSIENTSNIGGGVAWPLTTLKEVTTYAKEHGLKLHMDGARLFNAVVASQSTAAQVCSNFDTVTVCLSKGLGCPAGAILAYRGDHFKELRRLKQLMGGALRQSGILAAAGLYALGNNIERLSDDHANARKLAQGLDQKFVFLQVESTEPSTNMVFLKWKHPSTSVAEFKRACVDRHLRFSQVGPDRLRAVTHLDVSKEDIETAIQAVTEICEQYR